MAAVAVRSEMRRNCYDVLQNLSTGDILYVEYEKKSRYHAIKLNPRAFMRQDVSEPK